MYPATHTSYLYVWYWLLPFACLHPNVMKTQRFILTYTGEGAMPPGEVTQLRQQVAVLDQSRRSLLVEDTPDHLNQLLLSMPEWQAELERIYHKDLSGY